MADADAARIPRHIAIVMDGNGRWAKARHRPRSFGHNAGRKALREVVEGCLREGVQALTVFAFSSENWQRPQDEVGALMELFVRALDKEVDELHQHGVRMIGKMVSGQASTKNLSGVIGIAQVANASASMGPAWFLRFLALVSLSLAVLNLLPIPVLDGGHLLYYLIELVKGSPLSERTMMAGQYVGLFLLLTLMGLAFYNDIHRSLFL